PDPRTTSRMNVVPSPADARARAEAWCARLIAPDCSAQEREAFQRWRTQPGNAEAYAATERLLAGVDALAAGDGRMQALMQHARRRPAAPAHRSRRWSAWLAVA